jgi:hypothetical protein
MIASVSGFYAEALEYSEQSLRVATAQIERTLASGATRVDTALAELELPLRIEGRNL